MRQINGVPEPFGPDAGRLLKHQVLEHVWYESQRLEHGRRHYHDKLRVFSRGIHPKIVQVDPNVRAHINVCNHTEPAFYDPFTNL